CCVSVNLHGQFRFGAVVLLLFIPLFVPYTTLFRSRPPVRPSRCPSSACGRTAPTGSSSPRRSSTPMRNVGDDAPVGAVLPQADRSEEHTSELQSRFDLVCRLLLEKKNKKKKRNNKY